MLIHEREINERVRFEPLGEDRHRQYAEIYLDDESIGTERVLLPSKPLFYNEETESLEASEPTYQYYDCEHWHYAAPPALTGFPPYDSIVREDECNHPETGEVGTGWHGAYNSLDRLLHFAKDIQVVYECRPGDVIITPRGEGSFHHYELLPPVEPPGEGRNKILYIDFADLPSSFLPGHRLRVGVKNLPKLQGAPDPAYFGIHEVINSSAADRLLETVSVDEPE